MLHQKLVVIQDQQFVFLLKLVVQWDVYFVQLVKWDLKTNLKAEHIVSQVIHFADILQQRGEHVTNLVFMGMGEPMANYDEMIRAVRILTHDRGFGIGQRNITISTIGLISGIDKLAEENLQVGLAISLHAPNNELRKKLVPTAGPNSVEDIIEAGRTILQKNWTSCDF